MADKVSFDNLGIADSLLGKLKENRNIKVPTQVQAEMIPLVLQGRDVIGQSPTGTGKTLAYLLPTLSRIDPSIKGAQAFILAPTRELVMQITKLTNELIGDQGALAVPVFGGANINRQVDNLKKKPQLIVGTPGRVLELLRMRKINAQGIKTIIIDEADKMWQLGFKEDVQGIVKATPRDRQIDLVSATGTPELLAGAMRFVAEPELVNISPEAQVAETIKHIYFMTQENRKATALKRLILHYKPQKAIVFINSNRGVSPFVKRFREFGFTAEGLHSELKPEERKAVLEKFRSGKSKLLVTTDLFARGMDVEDVEIVFNFDLPVNAQHYIHRVGRTGRAGKSGLAINFVTTDQKFIMPKYEKQLKIKVDEWGITEDNVIPVKKRTISGTKPMDKNQSKPRRS